MPGLVVCGRRSSIVAGDDLDWKCYATISLRIVEIVLILPSMLLTIDNYGDGQECFELLDDRQHNFIGVLPASYPAVSLAVVLTSIVLDTAIVIISRRGTPTQPEKRKPIGYLFAFHIFAMPFLLLALIVCGIVDALFAADVAACIGIAADDGWMEALIVAICFQSIECCILMGYLIYRTNDELRRRMIHRSMLVAHEESAEEKWENRCRYCCRCTALCCCFSFGGRGIHKEDFSSISESLADLFQGWMLDVVPSDIRMGMHMLGLLQEERKQERVRTLKAELNSTNSDLEDCFRNENVVSVTADLKRALNFVKWSKDVEDGEGSTGEPLASASEREKAQGTLRRRQSLVYKAVKDTAGVHYEFEPRTILSPEYEEDRYAIAEGARFIRYSEAINTWKNYVFTYPLMGCCEVTFSACALSVRRHWKPSMEASVPVTVDDHRFPLHEAALLKVVGFDQSKVELAYAYFNRAKDAEGAVYCILVDHVWKSVVICIRGSLSLGDYVVNLDIAPESLDDAGEEFGFDGGGEFCHRGYLARAKWILQDMERHKILDSLMSKYNYQLRITGHSLGGGTAAPLAMMLRSRFPNLRCLCYGPPGFLFSRKTARRCEEFVTTFIVNSDLVPRVSVENIHLLRDEVLELIARIKVPKRVVAELSLTDKKLEDLPEGLGAFLHDKDGIPESDFAAGLSEFKDHLRSREERGGNQRISMYPPGRIVHLLKTSERDKRRERIRGFLRNRIFHLVTCDRYVTKDAFTPIWAEVESFNEIQVSKTIVSDHMVDYVRDAICGVAAQFGIDPFSPP